MGDKKDPKAAPVKMTVFEQLEELRPLLDEETALGKNPDIVRLALTNVIGAIDHVVSAQHQANPLWRR